MAQNARVSGVVAAINVREGTVRATGEPYRIEEARVIDIDAGVMADVTLPKVHEITKGQQVDWLVDLSTYGTAVQYRYSGVYPVAQPTPAVREVKAS